MLRRGFSDLFRECGDGVEADVSEHRDRGAGKDACRVEVGRIVEGMSEESGIVMHVPDRADDAAEKKQHDDHHARAERSFNCAEVLMPRRFIHVKKAAKKIIQM
jgi:hypothetical protein